MFLNALDGHVKTQGSRSICFRSQIDYTCMLILALNSWRIQKLKKKTAGVCTGLNRAQESPFKFNLMAESGFQPQKDAGAFRGSNDWNQWWAKPFQKSVDAHRQIQFRRTLLASAQIKCTLWRNLSEKNHAPMQIAGQPFYTAIEDLTISLIKPHSLEYP